MIYITHTASSSIIKNVWLVDIDDVEDKYIEFMQQKAKVLNIAISQYWLIIMNYSTHNSHLSLVEYKTKSEQWHKIKKQWSIDRFIAKVLKGQKMNYRSIINI